MQARVGLVEVVWEGVVHIDIGPGRENDPGIFRTLRERKTRGELGPEVCFNSLGEQLALIAVTTSYCAGEPICGYL